MRSERGMLPIPSHFIGHQFVKTTLEDLELGARLQKESEDQSLRADVNDSGKNQGYDLVDGRNPKHQGFIGVVRQPHSVR